MQKITQCIILSERSYCVFAPQGFVTKCFSIFIVDEVKNFAANNIFKLLELVTQWEPCIIGQSRTRIRAKGWRSYIEEFRGFEAVEDFYYKFIYEDCRVYGQRFIIVDCFSGRFPPRFFTMKLVCFIDFSELSYFVLFTIPLCMILMFVCFNKVYS